MSKEITGVYSRGINDKEYKPVKIVRSVPPRISRLYTKTNGACYVPRTLRNDPKDS